MKVGAAPLRYLACAVFATFASVSALANGVEFFNAQTDGPPVLYYFGHVKDTNGNVVEWLYQGDHEFKKEEPMPELTLPAANVVRLQTPLKESDIRNLNVE